MVVIDHTLLVSGPSSRDQPGMRSDRQPGLWRLLRRKKRVEWEAIVLFLAGTLPSREMLPAGMEYREFVVGIVALFDKLGRDAAESATRSGTPIAVIRVDAISDETPDLVRALQQTLYRDVEYGARVTMTSPIVEMRPPMRSAMACFVGARRQ